eukprot:scaffold2351_cov403-Prasinococcus_capsulatus_cf.AAC.20
MRHDYQTAARTHGCDGEARGRAAHKYIHAVARPRQQLGRRQGGFVWLLPARFPLPGAPGAAPAARCGPLTSSSLGLPLPPPRSPPPLPPPRRPRLAAAAAAHDDVLRCRGAADGARSLA